MGNYFNELRWKIIRANNLLQGGTSFVDLLCFCSVLCLLCFVRVCFTNRWPIIQKEIMDLEQLTPLYIETGISVDLMAVTWIYQVFQ